MHFFSDCNARVGSVVSSAVGNHEEEVQSPAGQLFHDFMLRQSLCAPATWLGGGKTWRSTRDMWHRIDFCCVPVQWGDSILSAWTVPYMLAIAETEDHRIAAITVMLQQSASDPEQVSWTSMVDNRVLETPAAQQAIASEWAKTPLLPWAWTAEQMQVAMSKWHRILLFRFCKTGFAAPKNAWLSDFTWAVCRGHARIRRNFFRSVDKAKAVREKLGYRAGIGLKHDWEQQRLDDLDSQIGELTEDLVIFRKATAAASRKDKCDWITQRALAISEGHSSGQSGPS